MLLSRTHRCPCGPHHLSKRGAAWTNAGAQRPTAPSAASQPPGVTEAEPECQQAPASRRAVLASLALLGTCAAWWQQARPVHADEAVVEAPSDGAGAATEVVPAAALDAPAADASADAAAAAAAEQGPVAEAPPPPPPPPAPPLTPAAAVVDAIRSDFVDKQYYVTGNLTRSLFDEGCTFIDPTVTVQGVDPYVQALQLLFDPVASRADLISLEVTAPDTVVLRWRLEGKLKLGGLSIKPYTGTTVYTISPERKVVRHEETWDISTLDAFVSTFIPSFGAPPAPPVAPRA